MRTIVVLLAALALPASALAADTTLSTDTTPPTIKVTGLPKAGKCTKKAKVKFSILDKDSGIKRIYVFFDGNVIGHHEPGDGALKVKFPKTVKAGRHRLGVLARDKAGNLAKLVKHFKVCSA